MTPEEWECLDARGQVAWWLAIPDDQRDAQIRKAQHMARVVLQVPLGLDGDHAANRVAMKAALKRVGHFVAADDDEWLTLHSSRMSRAFYAAKNWQQHLSEITHDHWPAYRLYSRTGRLPPQTKARWTEVGGRVYGGKLMAMKTDTVWSRFNPFGRPYPPYGHDDCLDVEPVMFEDVPLALGNFK